MQKNSSKSPWIYKSHWAAWCWCNHTYLSAGKRLIIMNHKKILLIDDDPDDQFIFMDATNELETGIECITANNGFEALALLNTVEPPPSLIFLDLNMPGI